MLWLLSVLDKGDREWPACIQPADKGMVKDEDRQDTWVLEVPASG